MKGRIRARRRGDGTASPPPSRHVTDWIFDLDNCLYPASAGLFDLIDERMGAYIQRLLDCDPVEARRVQKAHFHDHGTTLAGLMKHHGVDPHHFLADVHDIALDRIAADPRLDAGLGRLPGRKFSSPTATRLMPGACSTGSASRTISTHLHDIHAAELRPKPDAARLSPAGRPARHRSGARRDGRGHGAESRSPRKRSG